MKKIFYFILIIFLIPINIQAKTSANNAYIDATIQNNGDILVKELWYLKGNYTNFERTLNIQNDFNYIKYTDSNIYDADDIEIINIKAITIDKNLNYEYLNNEGDKFIETTSNLSEYGTYKLEKYTDSIVVNIYNPAKYQKAFYIEYLIKNKVVKNKDAAEINLNIINDDIEVDNLQMHINIANNKKLKLYPYNFKSNKIKIKSSELGIIKLNNINKKIDIKIIFDLDIINNSLKTSNINLNDYLDSNIETFIKLFDMDTTSEIKYTNITNLIYLWLIGALIIIIVFFIKNLSIKKDYNKIPSKDDPSVVNYLLKRKVDSKSLLASIISLISEDKISLNKVDNEYILTKGHAIPNALDEKIIKFIFGEDRDVSLKKILDKMVKYPAKASEELGSIYARVIMESKIKNYYENKIFNKVIKLIYSLLGMILGITLMIITYQKSNLFYLGILIIAISILLDYVVAKNKQKTKIGKTEYNKWIGLKEHLKKYDKNIENENLKHRIYAYGIILNIDSYLSKVFDIVNINNFMDEYDKLINKKIDKFLKNAHKIEAGTFSEDTNKINHERSDKIEKNN